MRNPMVRRVGRALAPDVWLPDPPQPMLTSARTPSAQRDVAFVVIADSFAVDD
jgi:hypothetical protein